MNHEKKDENGEIYWVVDGKRYYPESRPNRVRISKSEKEEIRKKLKMAGESQWDAGVMI